MLAVLLSLFDANPRFLAKPSHIIIITVAGKKANSKKSLTLVNLNLARIKMNTTHLADATT